MVHHFWRIIFLQLLKSMDIVSIIRILYIPYINKLSNSITYIVQTSLLSVGPKKRKKKVPTQKSPASQPFSDKQRISPFQKEFAPEATEPIGALTTIVPEARELVSPQKINMEHNHGGLEDHCPFFSWVICRFHVNLPWCFFSEVMV